jgi:UDP-N-acetyl-D-mannosaminuronic acid dehydrogenase
VIGLGYVGLPTAALIASSGIKTTGVDINQKHIEQLASGEFRTKEPGLEKLLYEAFISNQLSFSLSLTSCDAYIIAVPTPIGKDKSPGMESVLDAVEQIAKVLEPGQLIVLESTSPPGATRMVMARVKLLRPDLDISGENESAIKFAYCPERVLPGNALFEIVNNERLIGGVSIASSEIANALYSSFTKGKIVTCSAGEAELAKLVENSFRDVNVAFANEVSRVAENLGVQADKVIALANRHPRVNILSPGIGVGGHCISVDPWFLVNVSPEKTPLILQARLVNDKQPLRISTDISELFKSGNFRRIIFLGLAYKPDSDDLRESPAITIVKLVSSSNSGVLIISVEPNLSIESLESLKGDFGEIRNEIPEFEPEDLVIELVSHKEFETLDRKVNNYYRIPGVGHLKLAAKTL